MRNFGGFCRQTEQVVEQTVESRVAGDLRRNAINLLLGLFSVTTVALASVLIN